MTEALYFSSGFFIGGILWAVVLLALIDESKRQQWRLEQRSRAVPIDVYRR